MTPTSTSRPSAIAPTTSSSTVTRGARTPSAPPPARQSARPGEQHAALDQVRDDRQRGGLGQCRRVRLVRGGEQGELVATAARRRRSRRPAPRVTGSTSCAQRSPPSRASTCVSTSQPSAPRWRALAAGAAPSAVVRCGRSRSACRAASPAGRTRPATCGADGLVERLPAPPRRAGSGSAWPPGAHGDQPEADRLDPVRGEPVQPLVRARPRARSAASPASRSHSVTYCHRVGDLALEHPGVAARCRRTSRPPAPPSPRPRRAPSSRAAAASRRR